MSELPAEVSLGRPLFRSVAWVTTPSEARGTPSFREAKGLNMNHIMIDLETMGTRFDAPVIAIGAVAFNPATGELGETFYTAVDLEDAFKFGRVQGGTVKWWMMQGDDARAAAVKGRAPLASALEDLAAFYEKVSASNPAAVWGNGPTFDISALEYAYLRVFGRGAPWPFWQIRDCRTIKDIGSHLGVDTSISVGTAHNALDDAISQARWISAMWGRLREASTPALPSDFLG